jgi:hypothetical protein
MAGFIAVGQSKKRFWRRILSGAAKTIAACIAAIAAISGGVHCLDGSANSYRGGIQGEQSL